MSQPAVRHCPTCGSHYIRESRRGVLRYLTRLIWLRPLRCHTCGYRYWRFATRAGLIAPAT
jgi:predicted Zn-ribbon and HTH transcriptional regulator